MVILQETRALDLLSVVVRQADAARVGLEAVLIQSKCCRRAGLDGHLVLRPLLMAFLYRNIPLGTMVHGP